MGKKILLADDSITIQKVIELTFSDEDFEVVTVGNGRLAIERVQDVRPDIVLCDIIMPEKDGYEVCDFVKKNPALSQIPVLLLTGAFEPFDQERAVRVGSDGFLAKPFEPQTLIAKVKELLNQAASRAGAGRPAAASPASPPPVAAPAPTTYSPAPMYTTPAAPPAAPAFAPPPAPPVPSPTWSVASPSPVVLEPEPMPELEPEPPSSPSWARPPMPPPRPPMPAHEPAEVSFISDEPYTEPPPAPSAPPMAAPSRPSFPAYEAEATFEPEAFEPIPSSAHAPAAPREEEMYMPEPAPMEELMEVAPEEAASLTAEPLVAAPPTPAPSLPPMPVLATPPGGWIDQTVEVSLEERAQASAAAQHGEAESERFEEVFDADPTTPVPPHTSRIEAPPDVFSRFEPEFAAPAPKAKAPEPVPPPPKFEPAAPKFEAEFDDASTVVFKATPAPVPAPPAPAPPVPLAPPVPAVAAPHVVEEPPAPVFAPEPPSLNTFLASVMEQSRHRPTPAPAPAPPPPPPAPAPPEPEPIPVLHKAAPAWEPEPVITSVPDLQEEVSFSDIAAPEEPEAPAVPHSAAAEVPVPVDMVSQIAQRVIAQISDKVVREIAWEVIPDLAEAMIKKEIERLKAELEKV
jgi:CheY-like chemotaxis protein